MFATLFGKEMDGFFSIIVSFPTVFFTFFLLVSVLFLSISLLGLLDIDVLDGDIGDGGDVADGAASGISGLTMKLGLAGVPLPIIVTFISLFGWIASYYFVYFLIDYIPLGFVIIFRIALFFLSLYVAIKLTAIVARPIRSFFKAANGGAKQVIVGRVGIVRTGKVDKNFGEAFVEDGGAGQLLRVRSYDDTVYQRGDRVVIVEYDKPMGVYKIVSENEFEN